MIELTASEAEYQAAIPPCCAFQTLKSHVVELALCWGLCAAIRAGHAMDCTGCEFATRTALLNGDVTR